MKTKLMIGNGLFVLASLLLLIHLYLMISNLENRFFDFSGWIALIVASVYQIWLSKEKAKEGKSGNN